MKTLSDLKNLQEQVLHCLFNQDEVSLSFVISSTPQLSVKDRLAIYSGSITASHLKVLEETYPVCKRLVGDDFFKMMAVCFIKQTPSHQPTLNEYGKELVEFIAQYPPATALCYLSDVAKLEWAWQEALYGEYNDVFDLTKLENFSPERYHFIKFALPKDSTLLQSNYPIYRIWQTNRELNDNEVISLDEGGSYLLIWRRQYIMNVDVLTESEFTILQAIAAGKNLQQLIELAEQIGITQSFISLMQNFLQRGWIADCFDSQE